MSVWRFTAVAAWLVLTGCQEPTQITVTLTTDVPCEQLSGTAITFGQLFELGDKVPATTTSQCHEGAGAEAGIGSIVAVPSGEEDAQVAIEIVSSVDAPLDDCAPPEYASTCIVARRALSFIPDKRLTLPIVMRDSCRGIICPAGETCVRHECRPASVKPEECIGDTGCGEETLPPGTDPPVTFTEVRVTQDEAASQQPWMLWNGSELALVWVDAPAAQDPRVRFAHIDRDGEIIGAATAPGVPDPMVSVPNLALAPDGYYLSYPVTGHVALAKLSSNGDVIKTTFDPGQWPFVVSHDAGLLRAFVEESKLQLSLGNHGDQGVETSPVFAQAQPNGPLSVASSPGGYAMAWNDSRDGGTSVYLGMSDLDEKGTRLDATHTARMPTLVSLSNGYAVAWADFAPGVERLYLTFVDSDGHEIGDEKQISQGDGGVIQPSMAWSGDELGLAWSEQVDGVPQIHFARFDGNGAMLDPGIQRISDSSHGALGPSVAHDGTRFSVVWWDERHGNGEIYFAAIEP